MKKLFQRKSNIYLLAAIIVIAAVGVWCLAPGGGTATAPAPAIAGAGAAQIADKSAPLANGADAGADTRTDAAGASSADPYGQGTAAAGADTGTAANTEAGTNSGAAGSDTGAVNPYEANNPYQTNGGSASSGGGTTTANDSSGTGVPAPTVTLSIDCLTILNNTDKLTKGKEGLVGNGVIMSARTVTITEGETVFDVLTRETRAGGLHMESVFTPMYGSAYIEGIGNLYEFDCGPLSGWMYKVNGWYPNYGCSQYALKDGDVIEWRYTCDLGADIGGAGVVQG